MLDPISILEQRKDFLEGILEIAEACNWAASDIEDLRACIWETLVQVDNEMLRLQSATDDYYLAHKVWEVRMEDLRRWLARILGVKIKYF